MALTEKQMEHPRFDEFSDKANEALAQLIRSANLQDVDVRDFEAHANRVVDDLTSLLMRMDKAKRD